MSADRRILSQVSDRSGPPELHRRPAYEASEVEAFIEHVTARMTELERQVAQLDKRGGAGAGPAPASEADDHTRARQCEAERHIQARLAEADRYFADRLIDADLQAQAILEEARHQAQALMDAVRRSLEEAIRLKDEEVVAALGESHDRILALLDHNLRQRESRR
jgi:hypothetical protein